MHPRAAESRHFFGSGSHVLAFGVCNCVTSSIASKLTQPVLSTLTGGPAKKGFVTLSRRVALMLCSTVRSHSFSFALSASISYTEYIRKEEMYHKCMQTSLPMNQRGLDLFSAHTHAHALSSSPCVNFPLLHSVSFLLSF